MLCKRIIPCLDVKDGRTVKGVRFEGLRDAGDPVELAARYAREGADELVFLDITAGIEKRRTLVQLARQVALQVNIPFTVGGGIAQPADVEALLAAGADKVTINSAAVRNPPLIDALAHRFGSQCVVVAIDTRHTHGTDHVMLDGGRTPTPLHTLDWAREACQRGAGEILLTSMDHDGTLAGFGIGITAAVARAVPVPVVASGGGGTVQHFADVLQPNLADAALAASIFHYNSLPIGSLKEALHRQGIPVRLPSHLPSHLPA